MTVNTVNKFGKIRSYCRANVELNNHDIDGSINWAPQGLISSEGTQDADDSWALTTYISHYESI